ncbi:MAG: methylated-DNA--[protein]-cysteine S-methyltransferase [Methylophilaceae bacterium]
MQNKRHLQFDCIVSAPFGAVGLMQQNGQIAIEFISQKLDPKHSDNKTLSHISAQIEAYFADAKNELKPTSKLNGTEYQKRVWQAISAIPRGQVLTYGQIAHQIGSGPRAVANACGANNLPLVIPCHRVVAKNGLGGFMQGDPNGLKIKKWLLNHEGVKV